MNYELIIAHVSADLPKTLQDCRKQIKTCLEDATYVLECRVSAQSALARGKAQVRRPKDLKEYTDLDRTIMLESDVRELTEDYERAKGVESLILGRLQVLNSLLLHIPHG